MRRGTIHNSIASARSYHMLCDTSVTVPWYYFGMVLRCVCVVERELVREGELDRESRGESGFGFGG